MSKTLTSSTSASSERWSKPAAAGVDVRVVLPRQNDFKYGGRGNLVAANYLLAHGVRVLFLSRNDAT